jgi:hypothetical protein
MVLFFFSHVNTHISYSQNSDGKGGKKEKTVHDNTIDIFSLYSLLDYVYR